MPRRILIPAVLALAVGAACYWAFLGSTAQPKPATTATTPAETKPAPKVPEPASAPLTLPAAATPEAMPTGYITYPDGSCFPPLNGVKMAPKMAFHPQMAPFAKVVGKFRDARGREWYVHENGVRSTTFINGAGKESYEIEKDMPPQQIPSDELPEQPGK